MEHKNSLEKVKITERNKKTNIQIPTNKYTKGNKGNFPRNQ